MLDQLDLGDLLVEHGHELLSLSPELVQGVLLLLFYVNGLPASLAGVIEQARLH